VRPLVVLSSSFAVLVAVVPARAQSCRSVEVTFKPVPKLQIAVWLEDDQGNYVDTAYVTRLTGTFGLANRPGHHFLHSAVRFPYGRRDMVLPVWAHKRNKQYGFVMMGGTLGWSETTCVSAPSDCDDNTIAYHSAVSSSEPFYCSPSGARLTTVNGVDVVSCASAFYGSKGAYAQDGRVSFYPPRADLVAFNSNDGAEAHRFAAVNDLVAVSGATPEQMTLLNPPIRWSPPADGKYVVKIEMSLESDVNNFHNYQFSVDSQNGVGGGFDFNTYGKNYIGQPSIVYAVPITVDSYGDEGIATSYEGYGDWDGATGTEHPPDLTISDIPGSGAGRLLNATDGGKTFRVRVRALVTCGPPRDMSTTDDAGAASGGGGAVPPPSNCPPPFSPTHLTLTPHATSIDVSFASAATGVAAERFDLRYRATPIDDNTFANALPPDQTPPAPGAQGATVSTTISGLNPQKRYYVGVRSISACGAVSAVTAATTVTARQQFAILHGCFIATAAYGTALARELEPLRAVRDRALLPNPLGRLAVASYYALSPPLARAIASDERLRAGARALIAPLVAVARAGLSASAAIPK
jgi:hypothetical protein